MSDKKNYNEKFFDTILKEAASLYAGDLEDEYDNIEIPEADQYSDKHQDEMFNQIMSKIKEDEHNKNNNKKHKIFTFKKGLILVASIVLIMAAALNTTAVKMYFVKTTAQRDGDIYSFITGKVPENRYGELKEFKDKDELAVFEWLPDGMEITDMQESETSVYAEYYDKADNYISLDQYVLTNEVDLSLYAKGNTIEPTDCKVLGNDGKIIKCVNETNITNYIVTWHTDNMVYQIDTNLDKKTLKKVLKNIKLYKNVKKR